ncbi:MAG: hypothetical protein QXY12_02270 [Pyrobaculum sp.]
MVKHLCKPSWSWKGEGREGHQLVVSNPLGVGFVPRFVVTGKDGKTCLVLSVETSSGLRPGVCLGVAKWGFSPRHVKKGAPFHKPLAR